MDLAEFLLARIAEDEAAAREAADEQGSTEWWAKDYGHEGLGVLGFEPPYGPDESTAVTEHIADWDPARVLAECEAKRRIVSEFERLGGTEAAGMADGGATVMAIMDGLEIAMRALALPYADHESYRDEWRP